MKCQYPAGGRGHSSTGEMAAISNRPGASAPMPRGEDKGESKMACGKCGAESSVGAKFCRGCGSHLEAAVAPAPMAIVSNACPQCGHECSATASFCPKCGYRFGEAPLQQAPPPPSNPCPQCNNACVEAAKFCPKCGHQFGSAPFGAIPDQEEPAPLKPIVVEPPLVQPKVEQSRAAVPPAKVAKAQQPASGDIERSRTPLIATIVGVALAALIGGGGYYWKFMRAPATPPIAAPSVPELAPASTETPPPVQMAAPAEVPIEEGSPDEPEQASLPPPTMPPTMETTAVPSEPPPAVFAPQPESSLPVAAGAPSASKVSSAPAGLPPEMAPRIKTMLNQGRSYFARKQYDKAIATAEGVLLIDPGNTDARRLVNDANAGQQTALKSIEIQ